MYSLGPMLVPNHLGCHILFHSQGEIVSLPLKVNVTLPDGQDLGALLRNLELAVSEDEEVHVMVMEDVMTNGHVAEENDSLSDLSECTVKMPERKVCI